MKPNSPEVTTHLQVEEVLQDYRLAYQSRQVSLIGRREVLTGKAKFGIFGAGKELAQLAMAKVFRPGDIRSGYYRDQTFAFAKEIYTIPQFFAQLYAHIDVEADPHSAGRQMNTHQATRMLDEEGNWKDVKTLYQTSADLSSTAAQMPRLVGLAQASKLYRDIPGLPDPNLFSHQGNEVAFGTIGNASCAEGHFWEAINAMGVLQVPVIMSIWDDGYGISVPNEYQITKADLSAVLQGFQREEDGPGYELFTVKAWDYQALSEAYQTAEQYARNHHIPCLIHVTEVTQPQGHSTSGSHERYKSPERLIWEKEFDCVARLRNLILEKGIATEEELLAWEKEDRIQVRKLKNQAWEAFLAPIKKDITAFISLSLEVSAASQHKVAVRKIIDRLRRLTEPVRRDIMEAIHHILLVVREEDHPSIQKLIQWRNELNERCLFAYDAYLMGDTPHSPMQVEAVPPQYGEKAPMLNGFEILNRCFDQLFEQYPEIVAFGEDVGQLGDVNQGFAGLQEKYGKHRIMDTGIREATIMGQAIGLALRGFRPIAEIQYLDYFIYGLQTLSDDLASLSYRTFRGQKAPAIIRTRGHRLEGIWHSGSPMGMIIHSLRGIHICVPRDMTRAAGFYHTLMAGDEPGVVIEVLNGYRYKEPLPNNLPEIRTPLGVPEVLREGEDITVVTYGACCRIAMQAAQQLGQLGISVELIDVQTLLPFDLHHHIVKSLQKTNRILFLDEDVPGGATAYMMQQVLETQKGYRFLDAAPQTLTAKAHRPAYGTDGDYWSKPQTEHVFRAVYEIMNEADPHTFPIFY